MFLFHLTPVMSLKSLRSQMYAPHQRSAYVQTFVLLLLRTLYVRTYLRTYVRMRFYITIRKHFNHIVSPPTSSMRFFVSAFALSVAFVLLVLHDILLVLRIPPWRLTLDHWPLDHWPLTLDPWPSTLLLLLSLILSLLLFILILILLILLILPPPLLTTIIFETFETKKYFSLNL